MKKLFITLVLLIASLSGFSQSFSVDSKSLSVPRYANQAAITAANPSPTEGRMVYNSALDQFAYYNGTAWVNLSTGTSGPVLWTADPTTFRITANQGYTYGIEASRFTSNAPTSLSLPLINSTGDAKTFLRYGLDPQSTAAIFQESTTNWNFSGSSINWKHSDESNPQVITNMFGYNGGTFSVNGFTKLGDEATTTTSGVTKSSPAIKTMLLTGSMTPGSNPETAASLTTTITHGLNFSKIVDMKVLVLGVSNAGGRLVAEGFTDPIGVVTGYLFSTFTDGVSVHIIRSNASSTSSNNIRPSASVTATYKIYITYIP